ncbi:MAG: glycosyltransferase family 4 protein [Patescibacteria group bacterium]|nr:glycosyltransferase family 4 protein [Patescibacteria group bacterium]
MKVGIDARFLGPEGTGIGRYVEKLLDELQLIDKENQYVVFLRKSNYHLFQPKNQNFSKTLSDARWYSLKEQMVMPFKIQQAKVDLMHFPHFNIPVFWPGPFIVTIHDLIKSEFSGASSTTRVLPIYYFKHLVYANVMSQAVRRSKKIIVPTQFTKQKLIDKLDVPAEKIAVTYEAADQNFFEWGKKQISDGKIKQILCKYGLSKPYLIYVGNAYPYKNIDRLLEAMKLMNPNIKLINPCTRSAFYDRLGDKVRQLGLQNRVVLPGFVPDEELAVLYRAAEVYVFPSLSEGFGIPMLEAFASGLPVAASNASPLLEVGGKAAVYFDPYSPSDMAKKIEEVATNREMRRELIKKGFERAAEFSWRRTAEETLKVYKNALI